MINTKKIDEQNVEDILTLTPMQQGMLFHYLNQYESELYLEQLSFLISGEVEVEVLKKAWNFVVKQNEMLRTIFRWENLEKPVQIIQKKHTVPIIEYDLSHLDKDVKGLKIEEIKKEDRKDKINIAEFPFRITLCKLDENEYEMILSNYHIIFDGWSIGIILKEFVEVYNDIYKSETPRSYLKNKYKEFIKWQQKQNKELQLDYWKNYLCGFETKTLLPYDRKKVGERKGITDYIYKFKNELTCDVNNCLKTQNITIASLLYGAWGILLQKYNDVNDVVFGTTVSGRPVEIDGIENMVGLFINTPPLRLKTRKDIIISEFLSEINVMLREREAFECTSLLDIKNQSEIKNNEDMFDSIVVIENYPLDKNLNRENNLIDIKLSSIFEMTNYDITLVISTFDSISIRLIYDEELFDKNTIEKLIRQYNYIIKQMVNSPDLCMSEIEILCQEDMKEILSYSTSSHLKYPREKTIHELFEEQVKKTPHCVALTFDNEELTYKHLNNRANQMARMLIKKGVTNGTIVAIMMERSFDMIISLLAILKTGAAYLPIDANLPQERIINILENSGAEFLITNNKRIRNISYTKLQNFEDNNIKIVITDKRKHIKCFDELPIPDRSYIDISKYKNKIGMASATNCISIQTTRGCPYECLYCHKIWSKNHVFRTAENIYTEIEYFYQNGVRNFAVIDDCFNLNIENGKKLFRMIINNKLKIQLFFPNGLRGDILTHEFIDLMVEAGTRGINLSLETASPRLQKMLMKNLNLEKFRDSMEYIASKYPYIILEMATMHGFPTETEEEAMMTLNFIKDIKWIHFPYIHILKIFPNTEMEEFALKNGVSKEDILISKDRAFHELPETLPFAKSFTRKYQADFMNEYFLNKERLKQVLPAQMKILSEEALIQKYNAYLPTEIKSITDIIQFAKLDDFIIEDSYMNKKEEPITIFDRSTTNRQINSSAKKILFLDLSQHFSSESMLYKVSEQPIGHIYLMTYLKQQFGDKIDGKILKAGIDFDCYEELKALVNDLNPDMICIRTLTYFKELFHKTVALLRQWGFNMPILTGGPYASSDYDTILKDKNIDIVAFGEGEHTLTELISKMFECDFKLPDKQVLRTINGIAYREDCSCGEKDKSRQILLLDELTDEILLEDTENINKTVKSDNLAYVMYTSGSTGKPKGVMVEHRQVNNCIYWMQNEFCLKGQDVILQRTNLTFDPSVWEIFWPLYIGAAIRLITDEQSRDAEYIIKLMSEDNKITTMYCPASLITGITYILNSKAVKPRLKLPFIIIGAEPISMDIVKSFYSYFDGRLINTYGPTECTINNTYYYLERDAVNSIVPIGKPIANNKVYILSKELKLMPFNTSGEICIAGDSVARGYINDTEKTAESFMDNPFEEGKLYKTGDIGRWLKDGNLEIMGRVDDQIKIRGYRVELGEIRSAILTNPNVRDCAVIVRDSNNGVEEERVCKECGITSKYPNISIGEDNICNICRNADKYIEYAQQYFKSPNDLKELIITENKNKKSKYDCLLVYSCERVATYTLYKLLELGLNVLTATYDPGHMSEATKENIRRTTEKIGVDHIILTHKNSNEILRESLKTAKTMCKGCIHTSTSLAGKYAYENGIRVVIGETLSRGQIIENKLFKFFSKGITDVREIEEALEDINKNVPSINKNIFDYIDIAEIRDKALYDNVKFIDFYRYFDVTNEEMISFLNNKDTYWKELRSSATYSTDCYICSVGDYNFYHEKGYHYNGGAKSWEKRLGHITLDKLKEELKLTISKKEHKKFLEKIGYKKELLQEKIDTKYICAYVVGSHDLDITRLKDELKNKLPGYMIPSNIVILEEIPLTTSGKLDKRALPESELQNTSIKYEEPTNEIEKELEYIWRHILNLDRVGINDNFFDIGGNSILLIQMHGQLEKKFPGATTITDFFTNSTIAKLAKFIKQKQDKSYKVVELKPIELSPEYFNNSYIGNDQSKIYKFNVDNKLYMELISICKKQNVEIEDILLGLYSFMFNRIAGNKSITIETLMENNDFVYSLSLDFNSINNFNSLFDDINKKRKNKINHKIYNVQQMKKLKLTKLNYMIVPLMKTCSHIKNISLLDTYDIIFEIKKNESSIDIQCEYDCKRLKSENIKELVSMYMELMQLLVNNNK